MRVLACMHTKTGEDKTCTFCAPYQHPPWAEPYGIRPSLKSRNPGHGQQQNAGAGANSEGASSCGLGPHPQKSAGQQEGRRQRGGQGHEGDLRQA